MFDKTLTIDRLYTDLHDGKDDSDEEIGHPVDQYGNGHGRRSGSLREQFGGDHPGNGTGAHGEKFNEAQRGHDRQIGHPIDHFLYIAKKLLSGGRMAFFPNRGGETLRECIMEVITKKKNACTVVVSLNVQRRSSTMSESRLQRQGEANKQNHKVYI